MKLSGKWLQIGGSVYESVNGYRIHVGGLLIRTPDHEMISGFDMENYQKLHRYTKLMGGNRKRALMAWAESIQE